MRAPLGAWCEFWERSGAARLDDFFAPLAYGLGAVVPAIALCAAGFEPPAALAAGGALAALARRGRR